MQDTPSAPSTPQAPSLSQQIQEYIGSLPSIVQAQQQYGPQMEQNNYAIQKQYAPMYKQLQDSLYPELTTLRNQLTSQATIGAQDGGLTPEMRAQYLDQFRSEVGPNAGSGIASDYISRNMINQAQQYKAQNQNLGLSLIGAQPLYQAQQAGQAAQSVGQGYNAGSALNYGASTYGNYVGAYGSMYGTNAGMLNSQNQMYGQVAGGLLGGVGSYMGAGRIASAMKP